MKACVIECNGIKKVENLLFSKQNPFGKLCEMATCRILPTLWENVAHVHNCTRSKIWHRGFTFGTGYDAYSQVFLQREFYLSLIGNIV